MLNVISVDEDLKIMCDKGIMNETKIYLLPYGGFFYITLMIVDCIV